MSIKDVLGELPSGDAPKETMPQVAVENQGGRKFFLSADIANVSEVDQSFNAAARTFSLSESEKQQGREILSILTTGDLDSVQKMMAEIKNPDARSVKKAMLAVDAAISSENLNFSYDVQNIGYGDEKFGPVGSIKLTTKDGTLTLATDPRSNYGEGSDIGADNKLDCPDISAKVGTAT